MILLGVGGAKIVWRTEGSVLASVLVEVVAVSLVLVMVEAVADTYMRC